MLLTQPNEKRCAQMQQRHTFSIANCCPVSKNPGAGSTLTIAYTPDKYLLEVAALKAYIDSYIGGRGEVRSMEGMIQNITKDCADVLEVAVEVTAELQIVPIQTVHLTCSHP